MSGRFYVIEVLKGKAFRHTTYTDERTQKSYNGVVHIKAFSIIINEIVMDNGTPKKVLAASFPYCASRTGDFLSAITEIVKCSSILDIEYLMENLRPQLNVALDRDAKMALKKNLGLGRREQTYTVTISTHDKPLPRK
jgi:hypothetical protein